MTETPGRTLTELLDEIENSGSPEQRQEARRLVFKTLEQLKREEADREVAELRQQLEQRPAKLEAEIAELRRRVLGTDGGTE